MMKYSTKKFKQTGNSNRLRIVPILIYLHPVLYGTSDVFLKLLPDRSFSTSNTYVPVKANGLFKYTHCILFRMYLFISLPTGNRQYSYF